jgi:gamma-glutamyl-gamma-aminobutyrate hydrolase PuuD
MQIETVAGNSLIDRANWEYKQRVRDLQEAISRIIVEEDGAVEAVEEQAFVKAKEGKMFVI